MPNGWTWLVLAGSLLSAAGGVTAEEVPAGAMRLRVNPSGYERPRETLEEKIERRARESEYQFRWICRGCLPGGTEPRPAPSGAASR